ncbi:MAG: peptidylprolyl isomerase [Thermoanaerobaculales bacterium]|nr:peptidylprolyl isomerase [Thermoanaerobaculales bacterium]
MTNCNGTRALPACAMLGLVLVLVACDPCPTEDAIAELNSGAITRPEFESYLQSMDKRRLRTDASVPVEEGMRELLREYAATRILAAEGTAPTPPFEPVLYMSLKARYLVQYYRQRTGKRSREVTEEEALAAYEERLESRYTLPERIRFQHVFLRRDLHPPDELESLERKIVEEHRAGVPIVDLVAKYSESASKEHDGMVGPVFRGRLDESFEDQLYAQPVSDEPAVIRTELGSHIVLVVERKESRVLPFEEVKTQIVAGVIERKNEAERSEFFRTLSDRYGVVDRTEEECLGADEVVLSIKDRSVTRAELEDYLVRSAPFGDAHQSANPRARRSTVDGLVEFNLMYLDAVDQGLDQEPNFHERWRFSEMVMRAATALDERVRQWAESLDDEVVLEFYEQHEARFTLPRRLDLSYIFVPFGVQSPFEMQLRIEELKRVAVSEGFDSPVLAGRCAEESAICVNAGLVSTRDVGRISPKFQRAALALEAPGVSDPVKSENGLYVVAVHGAEDRRPMAPPDDMASIRARYVQFEEKSIVASIKERLLEENGFQVIAPLATDVDPEPGG